MEYFRDRFVQELNDEGEIEIRGVVFPRERVLREMDADAHQEVFNEWVDDAKRQAQERARDFLTASGCRERFNRLCQRVRRDSVLPWVGAGMSMPSGFPGWTNFLLELAAEAPEQADEIDQMLGASQFEEAAQAIADAANINILNENIENRFGLRPENPRGPILLLPQIFGSGCVTTNFDYTLEVAYEGYDRPFRLQFAGDALREAPRRAADERHCLFRIHGEANADQGRVLTRDEYNAAYGNEGTLEGVLNGLITNRSLLFMGASLSVDRTVMALGNLKDRADIQTPRHYAFLQVPNDNAEKTRRRRELERADIHPIWYPNDGEHDQHIEDLLICLMEGGYE